MKKIWIIILFFTVIINHSLESKAPLDSLKSYRLGEIVVSANEQSKELSESKFIELNYNQLIKLDALSISDLQLFIPSSQIRTNSRGESLLFIRGAGERQLGLFFDGALMNIPWDNRMDLSLVPTDAIGKITVNKNSNSIMYGANILGGAVTISTLERASDGFGITARIQMNDAATQSYSLFHDGKIGNFNYIANISYLNSGGFLISSNTPDTNNQNQGSKMRTNTDQKRLNLYARGEYKIGTGTTLGLAVNHINAEKGVAPEMNLAPNNTRYWRYPVWKRTLLTFNGEHYFDKDNNFRLLLTGWYDIFNQQIDAYKSIEYKEISETQKDDDKTFGVRASLGFQFLKNQFLNLVFNGFASNHIANVNGKESEFSQNTLSSGLEYKGIFDALEISAGGTFDYNKTPKTGVFVDAEGSTFSDIGAFLYAKYYFSNNFGIFSNLSRRTRFPTLREAYDGALNKFKVNPDLKPETGILSELGVLINLDNISVSLSGYADFYDDLIIRTGVPNDSLKRKQRVNLAKATIAGLDLAIRSTLFDRLNANLNLTYCYSEGEEVGVKVEHIEYKPQFFGNIILSYDNILNLYPQLELEFVGEQYAINPANNNAFEKLDASLVANFRLGYRLPEFSFLSMELFLRIDNIFDSYRLTQIGLPEAGRMFNLGAILRI